MPELPEVETLARDLRAAVLGRTITEACVAPDAPRLVQGMPARAFVDGLRGRRIEDVGRRGKFLLIRLSPEATPDPSPSTPTRSTPHPAQDDRVGGGEPALSGSEGAQDDRVGGGEPALSGSEGAQDDRVGGGEPALSGSEGAQDDRSGGGLWWLAHRRMSGNFIHRRQGAPDEPYLRARFRLDDGTELRFIDLRKFGAMWLTDEPEHVLAGLGPEPLDGVFTNEVLGAALAKRSAPVKAVLMDQTVVAGLGNLYADEALHYAAVHPLRPASGLSKKEVASLRQGIVRALEQGLRNLGSSVGHEAGEEVSLRDHVNLSGEPGSNQEYLVAYGREGRPCRTCGTPIERLKLSNRSAHYCPTCQAAPTLQDCAPSTSRAGRLEHSGLETQAKAT